MHQHLRNPLIYVWAILTIITVTSWWLTQGADSPFEINGTVTFGVLIIAAIKAQLVIHYFMDVRHAPAWLKRVTISWVVILMSLLLVIYKSFN